LDFFFFFLGFDFAPADEAARAKAGGGRWAAERAGREAAERHLGRAEDRSIEAMVDAERYRVELQSLDLDLDVRAKLFRAVTLALNPRKAQPYASQKLQLSITFVAYILWA
jgi:hypothetical protein